MKRLKQKIHSWLMEYLFSAVSEESFLKIRQTKGLHGPQNIGIIIGDKEYSENEIRELQHEINFILKSSAWKIIIESMRHTAYYMLYNKSQTIDDMVHAKATLYALDVLEKKFKNISNIKK